jgi:hypothetical protein
MACGPSNANSLEKKELDEILSIVYVHVEYTPSNMSNADEGAVVVAPARF